MNSERIIPIPKSHHKLTQKNDKFIRPIKDDIIAIDRQILLLILKRNNLIDKIGKKGHISPADEKIIREAWQKEATRVSSDPEISGRLFNILQKACFKQNPVSNQPSKDDIIAIDRQILHLILRRYNLINKIRKKGHILPADEKIIREAWQKEAARVSNDPEISGTLFNILQKAYFKQNPASSQTQTEQRKEAYVLNPSKLPVEIRMSAPVSSKMTQLWLYMGAMALHQIEIENFLQGNTVSTFLKILEQCNVLLKIGENKLTIIPQTPMGRPDTIFHIGSDAINFYVLLAHYLGGTSRVKITGDYIPELENLSPFIAFLPQMGCRLTPVIPKNPGLPIRLECSGVLPKEILFPANLPSDFAISLAVAANFYETPFVINLAQHPEKDNITDELLPFLKQANSEFHLENYALRITPSHPVLPFIPDVPLEESAAAFLLAFASLLKGKVNLKGEWPKWQKSLNLWQLLADLGLNWRKDKDHAWCDNTSGMKNFHLPNNINQRLSDLPAFALPLFCIFAAGSSLAGESVSFPHSLLKNPHVNAFFNAAGLNLKNDDHITVNPGAGILTWNAPNAYWGVALALAACAIPGKKSLKLGNPGIVTNWWKDFWQLYNTLPKPGEKISPHIQDATPQKRRRIITNAISIPPPEAYDD